jgi:hypothetical protein
MSSDLEDTHSVSMDIFDFIQKKKFFMENFQNKYDNKQLNSNNYSLNKIKKHTPIDLYEEKEEKDNQFKKSFDEVFLLYNNNFEDRESNFENNNRDHSSNNKDIDNNNEYKDIFYFIDIKGNYQERSLGRLRRDQIPLYEVKKDKFDKNNIMQKIIRHLIILALTLINEAHKLNHSGKKSEPLLRSIDAEEYNVYSNQKIYKFFNKTLGDVFSADISKKNSNFLRTHPKDYNKKKIETLKKENKEKNVIEILNLTVKELHEKYIKNEIPGLNFENDLIQIEKKHGIEYKDKYEKISLELKDIINEKGEKIKNV